MKKSILVLFASAQLLALAIAQDSGIFAVTGGQQYLAVAANATQVVAPEFQPPSAAIFSVSNVSTSGNSTTLNLVGDPPLDAYNAPVLADQYNKKVYPVYYAFVTDGLLIGNFYSVVSNNATQIVIDTQGETLSSTSIKSIDLRPYWTLETLFPASGAGAAFIATTSDSNIMTKLILSPTTVTDGQNPQNEGQQFYFSTSVGNWVRDTEPTISAGAVPVAPSRYLYLQNTGTESFAIDAYFAGTLLNMNNISTSNGTNSNTPNADAAGSTTSNSITSAKTIDEAKVIISSKIQTSLAQGAPVARSTSDAAALLGVSKSKLSKALKLAPAGIKSPNGKINISKLRNFLSKNSKAVSLLAGKSTSRRSVKFSTKKNNK
jgi:uncharacterized protein (TIGR02597 family)